MIEQLTKVKQYLLTGVSFAIPVIASGGILIALSIAFAGVIPGKGPNFADHHFCLLVSQIGGAAFAMMLPVLAGYISFGMAGKPGLAPGLIGGLLCGNYPADSFPGVKAGFLGALVAGLLAGFIVNMMKKIPVHKYIRPIMPILIIPATSTFIVGILLLTVIGHPIADLMDTLKVWLQNMGTGNTVVLGMILGAMIAFDMGGPVNKTAFLFAAGLIASGNNHVMGACAAAICTPPLGLGLATFISKKLWTEDEHESGIASFAMGTMGITEGAIPFAAGDPVRVIPCIMIGSMVSSTIAMCFGVGDPAPHGGLIVTPVIEKPLPYLIAIVCGVVVTALLINAVKFATQKKQVAESDAA